MKRQASLDNICNHNKHQQRTAKKMQITPKKNWKFTSKETQWLVNMLRDAQISQQCRETQNNDNSYSLSWQKNQWLDLKKQILGVCRETM